MLQAIFYEQPPNADAAPVEIGRVIVNGLIAEPTTDALRNLLAETDVFTPLDEFGNREMVEPEHGETYVSCLPYTFSGTYLWAELHYSV